MALGEYGPEEHREWADRIVAGLNMRDAERVPLLRLNGRLSVEQQDAIEAVMPKAGCVYELVSVADDGEISGQKAPGLPTVHSTYRFDATLDERCDGQASGVRQVGVLAIPEMGYWEPFVLLDG